MKEKRPTADHTECLKAEGEVKDGVKKLLSIKGKRTVSDFHKQLGNLMWEKCGMARDKAGLEEALREIPKIREEFWKNVDVTGDGEELNQALEKAGRVADFLELSELICKDALHREESCGGHFRSEYQTEDGEALRQDDKFAYVAAWEFKGVGSQPEMHKEMLNYEEIKLATRSYK
jgi:succinate dehydrogenase / fumarate reductase flavoprotein subunit